MTLFLLCDWLHNKLPESINDEEPITPSRWEENTVEQLTKIWTFIKERQKEVAQRMKSQYDKNRPRLELTTGDLVLLSTKSHHLLQGQRKHRPRYVGPYVIHKRINENAYFLDGLPQGVPSAQNVRYLKLFKPSPRKFRTRPTPEANVPHIIDGQYEWEVEDILDDRGTRGNFSYLVKWANTSQKQWLPLRCLTHCSKLLREYYHRHTMPIPEYVLSHIEEIEREEKEQEEAENLQDSNSTSSSASHYTTSVVSQQEDNDGNDSSDEDTNTQTNDTFPQTQIPLSPQPIADN